MNLTQTSSIYNLLEKQAQTRPQSIALKSLDGRSISYEALLSQIKYVIATINSIDIGCGDRVAIVLPNGLEMAITLLAISSGATSVPLNPAYQAQEFDYYLSDLKPKLVIVPKGVDSPVRNVADEKGIPILELVATPYLEQTVFQLMGSNVDIANKKPPKLAQREDIALILHTSGTTSAPKIVPLTQENICTSVDYICCSLKLSEDDRCLNFMPLFHIGGLVDLLLSPLSVGGSVICTSSFSRSNFFDWLEQFQPTWFQAVPTMLYELLELNSAEKQIANNSSLRFIRSVAAALPHITRTDLEATFKIPIIETYGMTEAAPLITSTPLPPEKHKSGSVGKSLGTKIAILDEEKNILPQGEIGEIVLQGKNIIQGYENNPQANAQSFTEKWFRTGDRGYLDQEGYLFLTGRLKEMINRGGEKITPWEIDNVLMSHPKVSQAVSFPIPHRYLGEDVAAAIVLKDDVELSQTELIKFAHARLADFKLPRKILFLSSIPKNAIGKTQRLKLADQLGLNQKSTSAIIQPSTETYLAPVGAMENLLAKIWSEVLGIKQIGVNDNFFDLGGHSLLAILLFTKIEKETGKKLPLATLFQAPTIKELATLLNNQEYLSHWTSLVPIQAGGSRRPFYCVHGAGGHVLNYHSLSRYLSPEQPFYGFQAQGLDGKHPVHDNFQDIAAHYIKEMREFQPEGPYFFGGYCGGGKIAFEMAQQLQAQGEQVGLLALFNSYNLPPSPPAKTFSVELLSKIKFLVKDFECHRRNLALLKPKDKLTFISERLKWGKRRFQTKIQANSEMLPLASVHQLHDRIMTDYTPQLYPGKISIFQTRELNASDQNTHIGWEKVALGGVEVYEIPAYFRGILIEPFVQNLAQKLEVSLKKAETKINS